MVFTERTLYPRRRHKILHGGEAVDGRAFREDIADRLELPAGAAGLMKLTVMGRTRALVEDHRGISLYSRECIEVKGRGELVRIRGEELELAAMDRDALLIRGRILCVELD